RPPVGLRFDRPCQRAMGAVPSDPGYMTLLPHPRFRYPNARRFVSRKPRSAPPFNNGRPACGLPLSTNRMRKKKPTRLPSTVPSATNAFGARPAKDRPEGDPEDRGHASRGHKADRVDDVPLRELHEDVDEKRGDAERDDGRDVCKGVLEVWVRILAGRVVQPIVQR